jgi:hypothetical protein
MLNSLEWRRSCGPRSAEGKAHGGVPKRRELFACFRKPRAWDLWVLAKPVKVVTVVQNRIRIRGERAKDTIGGEEVELIASMSG